VPTELAGTAHAEAMIGQGEVLASPLAMATVAASVAAGERVEPVLVRPAEGPASASPSAAASGSASPSSSASEAATPSEAPPSNLTAEEAATLRELMRGVVTEGSASDLADVPGIVGAKTGTAQYGDGTRQHVWMLAIADDLAVAVFVEDGDRGSTTAGPLLRKFLTGS
jgi:cell division protein FtsI/penicillin-binding protein 2